jgi:pimeloyl-ACP methyl ester carboxylesterase
MKWLKFMLLPAILFLHGCAPMGISTYPLVDLTDKYTDETSKFLKVDNSIIHYRDEGTGPTLLLLHGVASSLHTWDDWVERLAPHYRIIRIDLPGHGLTGNDSSIERYEISYMVDKLEKFLNKLNIGDINLAGNSLGGYIAWNYALHRPDRVKKMILLDAAGFPQNLPFIMSFTALPVIGELSGMIMPKFMIDMNIKEAFGDDEKVTDELQQRYFDLIMREGNREALVKVFRTMKEQSQNPHIGDRVKEIQTPTLLMWGDQDEWVPLEVMQQFVQALPNSQSIVYEGVGHMPMEELPDQTSLDAHEFFISGTILPSSLVEVAVP